jgi:hypothetical protein
MTCSGGRRGDEPGASDGGDAGTVEAGEWQLVDRIDVSVAPWWHLQPGPDGRGQAREGLAAAERPGGARRLVDGTEGAARREVSAVVLESDRTHCEGNGPPPPRLVTFGWNSRVKACSAPALEGASAPTGSAASHCIILRELIMARGWFYYSIIASCIFSLK